MHKDAMERICRAAMMRPENREQYGEYNIFVADGFSLPPHNAYRRFGISETEFPSGMYATLWFSAKDENLDAGGVFFCESLHDPQYDMATKKQARVNRAVKEAQGFIDRRKRLADGRK